MPEDLKKALTEAKEDTNTSVLRWKKVESLLETALWWVNEKEKCAIIPSWDHTLTAAEQVVATLKKIKLEVKNLKNLKKSKILKIKIKQIKPIQELELNILTSMKKTIKKILVETIELAKKLELEAKEALQKTMIWTSFSTSTKTKENIEKLKAEIVAIRVIEEKILTKIASFTSEIDTIDNLKNKANNFNLPELSSSKANSNSNLSKI